MAGARPVPPPRVGSPEPAPPGEQEKEGKSKKSKEKQAQAGIHTTRGAAGAQARKSKQKQGKANTRKQRRASTPQGGAAGAQAKQGKTPDRYKLDESKKIRKVKLTFFPPRLAHRFLVALLQSIAVVVNNYRPGTKFSYPQVRL